MTPTALRRPGAADMIWPLYASKLAQAIEQPADDIHDFVGDDLDTVLLWVRAIKQHYGPGTELLDVTHSVGVAAWFALHWMRVGEIQAVYGPPGPFDPETDSVGVHSLVRHFRFDEAPGYLYVLDAVAGTAADALKHGTLFDLALATAAFSSNPRIRAQQACLIYADPSVRGGDLASLFVPGTPLRVAWPLEGCPEVNWPANRILPPARDDDWYARFVAVPLAPDLAKSRARTVFDHPIAVTLYQPDGAGEAEHRALLDDLTYRFVTLRPAFLYAQTVKLIARGELGTSGQLWERFADATALLLEGPMMTTIPQVSRLNLGLLPSGLADTTPACDFVSGAPAGDISLRNVFIEVSALDAAGWESFERDRATEEVVRGLWLIREGDRFFLTVFMHSAAESDYIIGPVEALGEVVSLQGLSGPISSYCVLRQWGSDEPFYGDIGLESPATQGGIRLEGEPYARVNPRELLEPVQAELAARDQRPPPAGAGRTHRSSTADPSK